MDIPHEDLGQNDKEEGHPESSQDGTLGSLIVLFVVVCFLLCVF